MYVCYSSWPPGGLQPLRYFQAPIYRCLSVPERLYAICWGQHAKKHNPIGTSIYATNRSNMWFTWTQTTAGCALTSLSNSTSSTSIPSVQDVSLGQEREKTVIQTIWRSWFWLENTLRYKFLSSELITNDRVQNSILKMLVLFCVKSGTSMHLTPTAVLITVSQL